MKILFVISQTGFQPHELSAPKKILEDAGFEIEIASLERGICYGGDGISKVESQKSISEVVGNDYLGVVFIGGPGAYDDFIGNEDYYRLAKEAKKLGAICIAPTIISYSRVLTGKKVTGWNGDGLRQDEIEKNGAIFTGENVTREGNIITANGPIAAEEFGEELVDMFKND